MAGKAFLFDLVAVSLLATGCLGLGLAVNALRQPPLPLVYLTPEARLNDVVQELRVTKPENVALDSDVSREEMRRLGTDHSALILDARPMKKR